MAARRRGRRRRPGPWTGRGRAGDAGWPGSKQPSAIVPARLSTCGCPARDVPYGGLYRAGNCLVTLLVLIPRGRRPRSRSSADVQAPLVTFWRPCCRCACLLAPSASGAGVQPDGRGDHKDVPGASSMRRSARYTSSGNVFSPYYSWDAHLAMDVTIVRRGRGALAFSSMSRASGPRTSGNGSASAERDTCSVSATCTPGRRGSSSRQGCPISART